MSRDTWFSIPNTTTYHGVPPWYTYHVFSLNGVVKQKQNVASILQFKTCTTCATAYASSEGKRALARPRPRPRPRTQTKTRQTQDRRKTTAVRSGRTDQAPDQLDVAARLPSAVIEQRALPTAKSATRSS
ncbi:hypothetical protein J6590_011600 [Homalodisca vitripennis]|nr:hypothetical protein J6590_011600 [Homalodisca vitripennis]